MKFIIGDLVKVNKGSILRNLYAFDNDFIFIVKDTYHDKIVVLPFHKRNENCVGISPRNSFEFYHYNKRLTLIEKNEKKKEEKRIVFDLNDFHFINI
jgi:hypothetical protein